MTNEELDALVERLIHGEDMPEQDDDAFRWYKEITDEAAAAIQQLRNERDAMERLYEAEFNENNGLAIQREELRHQLAVEKECNKRLIAADEAMHQQLAECEREKAAIWESYKDCRTVHYAVTAERDKFKEEANIRRQQTADVALRIRELEAELRDIQSNKEELSELRKKIEEAEPVAIVNDSRNFGMHVRALAVVPCGAQLFTLEGIKK